MVTPILLYGAEVWGIYEYKEVDKLQIKLYKQLLGVSKQTPNAAVYSELGRYPLSILSKERSIMYWLKIMKKHDSLIHKAFSKQVEYNFNKSWSSKLKITLNNLGYNYLLQNYDTQFNYKRMLKQRIRDNYIQVWHAKLNESNKLFYYRMFKTEFQLENYLLITTNECLQKQLSRFRLSSHHLEIEKGRHNGIIREERLCKLCNSKAVESEYHFISCCPKYTVFTQKV